VFCLSRSGRGLWCRISFPTDQPLDRVKGEGWKGQQNFWSEDVKKETGSKYSEIWLLGDSNPKRWQGVLETPFDPRHPARHSIWTPVLDVIQDQVYRESRRRLDTSSLYIRNAIEDPSGKPASQSIMWEGISETEVRYFREILVEHRPKVLLSFGAFSFEFARRSLDQEPVRRYSYWGARQLGQEFRQRIAKFDLGAINLLPLLHVSIARGRFIQAHEYFCQQEGANYFEYVGKQIAEKLIDHQDELRIWIE